MRLSPVVIALIAVVVAQALARPQSESSETPELTFEKPHLITIVYCTSCGCYERNSKRIAEEIMDHFPDKHFEAVLTPRQGNFDYNENVLFITIFNFRILWYLHHQGWNQSESYSLVVRDENGGNRQISSNELAYSNNSKCNWWQDVNLITTKISFVQLSQYKYFSYV